MIMIIITVTQMFCYVINTDYNRKVDGDRQWQSEPRARALARSQILYLTIIPITL